jgi:16S rRNA processing protein RimM
MTEGEEDIVVGWVTGVHGVHGEIKVKPANRVAENLHAAKQLWMGRDGADGAWFRVEHVKTAGPSAVVKLEGVDDRDRAECHKGNVLKIKPEQCQTLPGGTYYLFELVGLKVVTGSSQAVGVIRNVLMLPAQPVLVVDADGKEVLIPAVKTFIRKVDLQSRTLVVEPIEGLLDGHDS